MKISSLSLIKKIFHILTKQLRKSFYLSTIILIFVTCIELLTLYFIIPIGSYFLKNETFINKFFINIFPDSFHLLSNNEKISILLIIFVTLFVLKNFLALILVYFKNKLNFDLYQHVSNNLFEKYTLKNYDFFLNTNSSKLIRNIQVESPMFTRLVMSIMLIFQDFLLLFAIVIFLILIDLRSTLIIFFGVGGLGLSYFLLIKGKLNIISKKRILYDALKIKKIQETFHGIKEVKLFSIEKFFFNKFKQYNFNSIKSLKIERFLAETPKVFFEIILIFFLMLVFKYFIIMGYSVKDTVILLSLFFFSSLRIIPAINRIMISFQNINFCIPSAEIIIKDFVNVKFKKENKNIDINEIKFNKNIQLKNINFKYKKSKKYIFKNLNLVIKKNEFIGIFGDSGSGKTTLLNIITGLINSKSGTILVDDKTINNRLIEWKKYIGYVPQNVYLLDDSIKTNIVYDRLCNKKKDINFLKKILKKTRLTSFIKSLPKGINTYVGEGSSRISGGQKQRIGIARALYKKPRILILDEPTSALDKRVEIQILKEIKGISKTIPVIIISHNKKVFKNCDRVYELKNMKLRISN